MKKIILILALFCVTLMPSCEDYLDVAPEAGLTEEEVYSKYANISDFFKAVYTGKSTGWQKYYEMNIRTSFPTHFMGWIIKWAFNGCTEHYDTGRYLTSHSMKSGDFVGDVSLFTSSQNSRPILYAMFKVIRICNLTIQNIDKVQDANTQEDLDDLMGQAYFVRAYAHMTLDNYWGPMPHIVKPIGPYDDWDIERPTRNEAYNDVANDLDTAYMYFEKAGRVRRDPFPGQAGHLTDPLQDRPAGAAAKAFKSRALLYAASPLNNANGTADYEKAAVAAAEAIAVAEQQQYELLPMADYSDNFYGVQHSNEQIWSHYLGSFSYNSTTLQSILGGVFQNNAAYTSGEMPSQNLVDRYETIYGEPLRTEEDRAAAAAAGHYNAQDPYVNLDKRFYNNIYYNQAPIQWNKSIPSSETKGVCNIYFKRNDGSSTTWSTFQNQKFKGVTLTGYYERKLTGDLSYGNSFSLKMTEALIRMAELYLNYAEAANEAYGPTGSAPGCSYTAADALNKVRNRAGLPNVSDKYLASKELFRDRVYNERIVEFDQEGFHYYFDSRRWKTCEVDMRQPMTTMTIEKLDAPTEDYPTGFKYVRGLMPDDRQVNWFDHMYYLPLPTTDYYKLKDFDTSYNQW